MGLLGPNVVGLPVHLSPQYTLTPPDDPNSLPTPPRSPQMPPWCTYTLLAPEYLHFLPAPVHPWHLLMPPNRPQQLLGTPKCPLIPPIPFWPLSTYTSCQPQYTPDIPTPLMSPMAPTPLGTPKCPLMPPIPLLTMSTYTPYQLPYTPDTPYTPWCPPNGLQHPVDAQHWKTNKEVWTWTDDWPSWRASTYERPFTQEGNYLVMFSLHRLCRNWPYTFI